MKSGLAGLTTKQFQAKKTRHGKFRQITVPIHTAPVWRVQVKHNRLIERRETVAKPFHAT
jgi:hypothetical protein